MVDMGTDAALNRKSLPTGTNVDRASGAGDIVPGLCCAAASMKSAKHLGCRRLRRLQAQP
jgi:hypothetical protein